MTVTGHVAHAVVVLAAGASARLGQPKQLLRHEGETLLRRVVRLASGTAPAVLVVVLPPDAKALDQTLSGLPYRAVINPAPQRGMRTSLQAAAAEVERFSNVLVLGCDQPALQASHLHALLRGARNAPSGCAATRSDTPRVSARSDTPRVSARSMSMQPRTQPPGIPAVVPGHWFTNLAVGDNDSGFRARLRDLDATALYLLDAPALALDIDTPDDLRQARALGIIDA